MMAVLPQAFYEVGLTETGLFISAGSPKKSGGRRSAQVLTGLRLFDPPLCFEEATAQAGKYPSTPESASR